MSDQTNNLALPYILPSQAQKHVTHNEALQRLDAIVQLCIVGEASLPPPAPTEGQCYLVAEGADGPWAGKGGRLAFRQDDAWLYIVPQAGWRAFFAEPGQLRVFRNNEWHVISPDADSSIPMIGVNAAPDGLNRLSVASEASLFTHAGHGHQLKLNKASAVETGSVLFQTAWSGRAEMGLAGNDDFAIKVSGNGSDWITALTVSPRGTVRTPARPAARTSLATSTSTPASGSRTGFSDFHLLQGGFTLGAVVPSGVGSRLLVPETGVYLLLLTESIVSSSGHETVLEANGATALVSSIGPASTSPTRHTACTVASLSEGDWLALRHEGSAQYAFGATETELSAVML